MPSQFTPVVAHTDSNVFSPGDFWPGANNPTVLEQVVDGGCLFHLYVSAYTTQTSRAVFSGDLG